MKCPKCGTDSPENNKFCLECGQKLTKVCPRCSTENLPGAKFCGECGRNLVLQTELSPREFSTDEKLARMKRYLPKDLTEKILAQRDKIEGERKRVSVMFCDMEGFTGLSERLDPEEIYSIMDGVYEILIQKVHEYGGTVNEMTGDGIIALFGAPIALEDAPQRAIRSACEIHREMVRYNDRIKEERGSIQSIKMRIGIHTGPVVVGTLGNDLRVEFKAVGDTVNIASRVEGLAEPGTTYVSEDTFRLTEGMFRFEALGGKEVKGREEGVKVYRVIAPSMRRTRFDISAERGLTPFVGRGRELELLIDGFERVKGGRGQAFSVMAEAGVGKSRLLYEFRKVVANEDVTFLEGKCLSYSRGVAYHPVIDILKASFEIQGGDEDSVIREKVQNGLKALGIEEASTLPYLLELLSVRDSGIDSIPMSPEESKARILDSLKRIVLKRSEIRPLIMAIEDLHWIDNSSEESLKELLDDISGSRVLMIFTYRPEFVHTWGGRSYHCQVNLNRFSNRESLIMVSNLLGVEELDNNLEDFILERTEGVPFFIEEFIKSLRDLKVIEKKGNKYSAAKDLEDVSIPSTIQDVIMARVDSLPEAVKRMLQTGSVIGREFGYELIKEVTGLAEQELLSHLSILKDSELLYERGIYPQSIYIFKHALTLDAVYQSLLKSTRKRYHQEVAQVLEEGFSGVAETQPELLGHHYTEAGNAERAIPYWQRAGDIAIRRSAHMVAVAHFTRGLELFKALPDNPKRAQQELDLQMALGNTLMTIRGYGAPGVKRALDRARELCRQVGETSQLFPVLHGLWIFYIAQGESQTSHEMAEQCLDLAQRLKDPALLMEAHHALGSNFLWRGEYTSALKHFEQGSTLYDSLPSSSQVLPPGREDPGVVHKSHAAHALWLLGYPDRAIKKIQTAKELGRRLHHPFSMVFALFSEALIHLFCREFPLAMDQAEAAVEISKEQGFGLWLAWARVYLGSVLAAQGRGEEGISEICRGLDFINSSIEVFHHFRVLLAEAYGKVGKIKEGFVSLAEAQKAMEKTGLWFFEAELHRTRGELLLMQEIPDERNAEDEFRKAIEIARRKQAKSLELRAAFSLSRLWQKRGKKEEARNILSEIYGWFTEGFDTGDLKEAKALLEELS